jgi:transposase
MAVNNEDQHEQAGDHRSRPRWSAGKKVEAVLRLLRGEPLETLSRELGVGAHRLAAWRDDFLEGGKEALRGQRPDRSADDRALKQAERKVGQLTMENEVLRAAAEKRGSRSRRRSGPGSHGTPAAGGRGVPRARRAALHGVCPPARRQSKVPTRPGPVTSIGDHGLLQLIRRAARLAVRR